MKYYSELTKKVYDSPKEVEAAEAEIKAAEERKAKLQEKRADRAKEIEAAYKDIINAQKKYSDLVDAFVKDYGSFHMTYTDDKPLVAPFYELLKELF